MKKVLIAFEGTSFSEGALAFARQLNDLQPLFLTGVFVPQISYANLMQHPTETGEGEEMQEVVANKNQFESFCERNNIKYKVHIDAHDFALPEIAWETRFADLLLIGGETFYRSIYLGNPLEYLKETLHLAECPTVVVPEKFRFPRTNLLAYDGSESSLFAIKQFAYLFPGLCNHETVVAYAANEEENIPALSRVKELVFAHFTDVRFVQLVKPAHVSFANVAKENQDVFLVCGAFGRPPFSELIRRSFAETFLVDLNIPVFIAHK